MVIPYFLLWLIYVLITMKQRDEYLTGLSKGMHVEESKDDSWLIKGSATIYTFNPNKKPVRNYTTWREFWQARGY